MTPSPSEPNRLSIAFLLDLQRKAGNQATVRLLGRKPARAAAAVVATDTLPVDAGVAAAASGVPSATAIRRFWLWLLDAFAWIAGRRTD